MNGGSWSGSIFTGPGLGKFGGLPRKWRAMTWKNHHRHRFRQHREAPVSMADEDLEALISQTRNLQAMLLVAKPKLTSYVLGCQADKIQAMLFLPNAMIYKPCYQNVEGKLYTRRYKPTTYMVPNCQNMAAGTNVSTWDPDSQIARTRQHRISYGSWESICQNAAARLDLLLDPIYIYISSNRQNAAAGLSFQ